MLASELPWQRAGPGREDEEPLPHELPPLSGARARGRRLLRSLRRQARARLPFLRGGGWPRREVLPQLRIAAPGRRSRSCRFHALAPRDEDTGLSGLTRGRAKAGHGALRRPARLDGTAGRTRSRRGATADGPGRAADDGRGPPL